MKYKVGDKFKENAYDVLGIEILSVENGYYHVKEARGIISHITDGCIENRFTLITPKAPVKGKVYKVWDDRPEINYYAKCVGFNDKQRPYDHNSRHWDNWELVVQAEE